MQLNASYKNMYKTDFVCTYKEFEKFEDDEVDADMMYRAQYLQIFGLVEYDERAISASLDLIKSKVIELPELRELILKHPHNSSFTSMEYNEDTVSDMLLVCLFAYPTMDAFHLCLIDAFKHGNITETSREKLLKAYSSMTLSHDAQEQ
jgi:hypothetical protein